MERVNQNLEFPQKSSTKSNECYERHLNNLYNLTRPSCASGGDTGDIQPTGLQCNSKNSSCQDFSCAIELFDQHFINASDDKQAHNTLAENSISTNAKQKSTTCEFGSKLKSELSRYKKELKEYNNTTKDLEEKYLMINYELSQMQQMHDRFVAKRKNMTNEEDDGTDSSSSIGSEYSLKRKYTQVFHRGNSFFTLLQAAQSNSSNENIPRNLKHQPPSHAENSSQDKKKRPHTNLHHLREYHDCLRHNNINIQNNATSKKGHQTKRRQDNKENEPPPKLGLGSFQERSPNSGLKDIYNALKSAMENNEMKSNDLNELNLRELQSTIASLQSEQSQFRNIIQQQQSCLQDYHSRCIKAQKIMHTQQIEIEKLNSNNQQLETEITSGIDQLRVKIDNKLRDVSHLPQMMHQEKIKTEKTIKENNALNERLRAVQTEATELRHKLEELTRRKGMTISRLKSAERDLKIFKNYNTALKHEKRKLCEELQKVKEQLECISSNSKRTLARQKEQTEKHRRELQKRVFELELKLSRSQNSTTSLIQERDSLIAELQQQLNTLVHNFEVSQKHIRVLRRHIYSMSGGSVRSNNLNGAV